MASGIAGGGRRAGDAPPRLGLQGFRPAAFAVHAVPPLLLRVVVIAILLETYTHVKHNRIVSRFDQHRDPPPSDWVPHVAHCCLYYLLSVEGARSGERFVRQRKRSSQLESIDNPGFIKQHENSRHKL